MSYKNYAGKGLKKPMKQQFSMNFDINAEELKVKIEEKTGKSRQEIEKMVEEKVERFAGLLSEEGAVYMIARELGVVTEIEGRHHKLDELRAGMNNITVIAKVTKVLPERIYEKEGRKLRRAVVMLDDGTASIPLVLWNDEVKQAEKLQKGSVLKLTNCRVTSFGDTLQLRLTHASKIESADGLDEVKISEITPISELKEGLKAIDVIGIVQRIYEPRSFTHKDRQGILQAFELKDISGTCRVVAWNDRVKDIAELAVGDVIKLENAYTKQNLGNVELHLGGGSRIVIGPMLSKEEAKLINHEALAPERKTLANVNDIEEGKVIEICATIVATTGFRVLKFCNQCNGLVTSGDICPDCKSDKLRARPMLRISLDDGTASVQCSLFGRTIERLIGKELLEQCIVEGEQAAVNKLLSIVGREVIIWTTVRRNNVGEKELLAKEIVKLSHTREAKHLLDRVKKMLEFSGSEV